MTPRDPQAHFPHALLPENKSDWPALRWLVLRHPLLHLSMGLTLGLALLCFGLIGSSRAQPAPLDENGLATCAGIPCFRGLIPGETPWPEALARFDGETGTRRDLYYARIALFSSNDGSTLDGILLNQPRRHGLTLAAALARFGPPTCTQIYRESGYFALHYPLLHIATRFDEHRLKPSSPVTSILVVSPNADPDRFGFVCDLVKADTGLLTLHEWNGFAPMWRYLNPLS